MIADRRSPGPGARHFQEYVSDATVYLRDADGPRRGAAPSPTATNEIGSARIRRASPKPTPSTDALGRLRAADGELRVVIHTRLGDLIHPDLSVNASATALTSISMRSQGGHLRNALRVVAELRARRLPGRRVHALILSDSPPETVAATLEGLDVGIRVGARGDGRAALADGRTVGLETTST
ncbi:hypothetical protein JL720_15690 [Aureococcus anophagefferens]|nr:hypothetical protein JL720_15690 [Aureococcus anophagefferens]